MKLKQVTFAEALENMGKGNYAYSVHEMKYRISHSQIQCEISGNWTATSNDLSDVLNTWLIEVEPMRDTYDTQVRADGFLPGLSYGPQWFGMRVRVTVEEI